MTGKGKNQTRSRNKRRKESKRLSFIKSKGILPATATKADLRKFEEEITQPETLGTIAVGGVDAAFEAKKQDLLTSIAAGGIDVSLDPSLLQTDVRSIENQLPGHDSLSVTDQPATAENSGKVNSEIYPATGPISTSVIAEVQDSVTGSPLKHKEVALTDFIGTTITATLPDSVTAPAVEATEILATVSPNTPDTIEVSKPEITPAPGSQHRRSKLDVSGAKRMLFGSLGLRTPKTKDDELKTREKLMKDMRPVKDPHFSEKVETVEDLAAVADDESWKDKIDLRAVECCYEGIELSAPPFPFVQRWDPQQQRGYQMGNATNRKGKKRKRNNNYYYEYSSLRPQVKAARRSNQRYNGDSSNNLEGEVMHLNEDEWPRQEAEPEPSIKKANAEGKDQERSHDEEFEDSVKANEQLLHETVDASADTLVEMEDIIDLPTLPEDISMCPPWTLDRAAKGNIIAFKQLEMSAETGWQPKISEFRTAIVEEIIDDGTLSMRLAKRDRPSKDIQYDEKTGERLYSKFEMPGYQDENGEDRNGNIEISFDELINPVLIRATGEKGNRNDMLQAADDVVADFNPNDRAATEEDRDIDAGQQGVSLDCPPREVSNEETAESREEARQEISELIRDAGWRSSVRSEVNHDLINRQDEGAPGQRDDPNEPTPASSSWPKFHGFSSSPLSKGFQVASSPPPAALQSSERALASGSEIPESVPLQDAKDSPARSIISNRRSAIDYPDLPQMNDDSEVFHQEAQDRSGLSEADHQIASQDLTSLSSIRRSPSQSIASPTLTSTGTSSSKLVNILDGADSDESLPELFSQAFEKRMSQAREIKSESSDNDPISPPCKRKSKRNSRVALSQRESNRDWEPDSEGEPEEGAGSTPGPSQPVFSSQIIDLTISSDTVDPPDDSYNDDDSFVLPNGPGWVKKNRTSMSRNGPTQKIATKRSTRSR